MSHKNLSARIKIPKILNKILKNTKINQIYNKFEKSLKIEKNFAVAVSGGPDSLALAFLAKVYAIKKKLKPKFLIVDHKLRAESSKEAKTVKKLLKKLSIEANDTRISLDIIFLVWHLPFVKLFIFNIEINIKNI